ncbi:SGNH/GDSL hydrolase family protein [Sphingomonas sp. VDB2]|uniref:SGNH/GDSL hydrolase family protein n=1 Tax=Sphingomonas sp. VDB2 TaxID=3228751 RepID=UPI003A801B88
MSHPMGLSPAGALIVRAGEPFALRVIVTDAQGVPQDMVGKTFALAFLISGQTDPFLVRDSYLEEGGKSALLMGDAAAATQIFLTGASKAISYYFTETTSGASFTHYYEQVKVEPGPDFPTDRAPIVAAIPAIEVTMDAATLAIVQRGAAGDRASLELFKADIIDEPTAAAMDAHNRAEAVAAVAPFVETVENLVDQADAAKGAANTFRGQAETAAGRAEIAATTAQTIGKLYSTTGEGLAQTDEGAPFWVRSADDQRVAEEYLKLAGIAVPTGKTTPSAELVLFVADTVRRTDGPAMPNEAAVQWKNLLGQLWAYFYSQGGFDLPGFKFGRPSDSGPFLRGTNRLGQSPFGVDDDGAVILPGGRLTGDVRGGMSYRNDLGDLIIGSEESGTRLPGMVVREISDAYVRSVNGLGQVNFVADASGFRSGDGDDGGVIPPPEPVIDVLPMIGSELFLTSDRALPLYVENIRMSRSDDRFGRVTIDSRAGPPAKSFCGSSVDNVIELDPSRMGSTATLTVRTIGNRTARLVKTLSVMVKTVPLAAAMTVILMLWGDSITNRQMAQFIKAYLESWGFTVIFVGTINGSASSTDAQNVAGPLGEAHEGWAFSDVLGYDMTDGDIPYGPLPVGQEAAYMALSKAEKNKWNPYLCPVGSSSASTPIVTVGGQQYRADLSFFEQRFAPFGFVRPDIVPLNFGMNDRNEQGAVKALEQVNQGYGYVLDEIERAWPATKVIVWSSAMPVDLTGDATWQGSWAAIINAVTAIVKARRDAGKINVHLCSAWAHQSAEAGWATSAGSTDSVTGIRTTTISDIIHPFGIAREQQALALASTIACIA